MGEHTIIVLKEMCNRVNADYDSIDFKAERWSMEYSWTEKEQDEFKDWLADYLYNNTKARREITGYNIKNKKSCNTTAMWFAFNFGWKYK